MKKTYCGCNGNATVEFSLSDNITAGKDGANGKDGSVGATGKDGSSVVLNGKDGSIGMTGPKGQDGKDGINGRDGANISITSAKGEQVLVNRDPAHNGDTEKLNVSYMFQKMLMVTLFKVLMVRTLYVK